MSRVLKFRAWDSATGKVSEPFDVKESWGDYLIDFDDYSTDGALDSIIWEQFTGLLDRNGKEIYEGDRIKIEGSDTVYTVEYGRGVWMARFGDESGDNICLFHYVQKDMVLYAEVIGNIHEPPKDFRPEHLKRMGVSISKGGGE